MTYEDGWLVGILEGEGCFHMEVRWRPKQGLSVSPLIRVGMTDKDVVDRVAALWGTKVSKCEPKDGRKHVYQTAIYGVAAMGEMLALYPCMGRRRQAKIREIAEGFRVLSRANLTKPRFAGRKENEMQVNSLLNSVRSEKFFGLDL